MYNNIFNRRIWYYVQRWWIMPVFISHQEIIYSWTSLLQERQISLILRCHRQENRYCHLHQQGLLLQSWIPVLSRGHLLDHSPGTESSNIYPKSLIRSVIKYMMQITLWQLQSFLITAFLHVDYLFIKVLYKNIWNYLIIKWTNSRKLTIFFLRII